MTKLYAFLLAVSLALCAPLAAQPFPDPSPQATTAGAAEERTPRDSSPPDRYTQLEQLRHAMARLPIAAGLAVALALRPRRRGTPRRQAPVIQTQIILAIVGAVVMLVVGASLARAFGIVGAAGLVRYRAKIEDPKDAGVMLSTLAIGLASGVGLWMLATFSTAFILVILWVVESFEPTARLLFELKVKRKDSIALKTGIEELLTRHRLEHEFRSATTDEVCYEVKIPIDRRSKINRITDTILKLNADEETGVEWEEKKEKNKN